MSDDEQVTFRAFQGVSEDIWSQLYAAAVAARQHAWAPYSGFAVGAALQTAAGTVASGTNVENATFGATICAERVAVGEAVSKGETEYVGLCIVTDQSPPAPPCGICRQVLSEFHQSLPILLANLEGETEWIGLDELLPRPFVELPAQSDRD